MERHASILQAMPSEPSPRLEAEQGRVRWSTADLLSAVRIPLAIAFPFASRMSPPVPSGFTVARPGAFGGRVPSATHWFRWKNADCE